MSEASAIPSTGSRLSKGAATATAVAASFLMLAVVALAATASAGAAEFGEDFRVADVNVPGAQNAPAFPGDTAFWAGTCDLAAAAPDPSAGALTPPPGAQPDWTPRDCLDFGAIEEGFPPPTLDVWSTPPAWRLLPVTDAGAHPDASTSFWFNRSIVDAGPADVARPGGSLKDAVLDIPPGFVGDPTAVPYCSSALARFVPPKCPPETQVGVATDSLTTTGGLSIEHKPVYNVEPRRGKTAEFLIGGAGAPVGGGLSNIPIVAQARTDGDFGVRTMAVNIPSGFPLFAAQVTLWGVPWAASNDKWRIPGGESLHAIASIPAGGLPLSDRAPYDPSWGPIRPFLSMMTECSPTNPATILGVSAWTTPDVFKSYATVNPLVDGCDAPPFDPAIALRPTATSAGSASGLDVDLRIPQIPENSAVAPPEAPTEDTSAAGVEQYVDDAKTHWQSDAGRSTAHLKDSVVDLPEGLTVNPSGATGLTSCSDAQMGVTNASSSPPLFNNDDPFDGEGPVECPSGSILGTAEVDTPLLNETLTGHVVLGEPKSTDPTSGEMLRLFIVVRNDDRGLIAKIFGRTMADGRVGEGGSGKLHAVFENNPRVPFDELRLDFKGGQHGLLAMPRDCGTKQSLSRFTPWTAAHGGGGPIRDVVDQFAVDGCSNAFAPVLAAGMDNQRARGNGTFSFRFSRTDGEQWLRGLNARLPQGLLASVKDLPLCSDAQAGAGACPAGSKIGIVDAKAGAGDPFVLEEKGEVFLTEGYKGGEYGLMVKVRAIAGPFRGARELTPIVVRQAIHVDRRTAQVTAVSDPFPQVWHGVPLRVREVNVIVNRPGFMLNPSDCSAKQVGADLVSDRGAGSSAAHSFRASGCAGLAFKPRLALRLTGRKQIRTGRHPGVRAQVTQKGVSEAGIERAVVRLPKSLALDVDNAQALCEFADGTRPDLENHCPKGSIVGRARAVSPLLNDPLVGNVYFVKNIRIDPDTGNQIRTLPMIMVALRGEIAINLKGASSTTKGGKLVNTFNDVPDAPVSKFNLNIKGGRNGILAVTRTRKARINLCSKPKSHVAEADMDGHNGKRFDRNIKMKTPCARKAKVVCRTRKQKRTKACKAKAKRNAAERRASKRRSA